MKSSPDRNVVEHRRPVGVVGLADPRGEEGLRLGELDLLAGGLVLDPDQLGVEDGARGDQLVDRVLRLRAMSTVMPTIWVLTVEEVRVELREGRLRARDLRLEHGLAGREVPDGLLLPIDQVLESLLARVGVFELVGANGARGRGREQPAALTRGRRGEGGTGSRCGPGGWCSSPGRQSRGRA